MFSIQLKKNNAGGWQGNLGNPVYLCSFVVLRRVWNKNIHLGKTQLVDFVQFYASNNYMEICVLPAESKAAVTNVFC